MNFKALLQNKKVWWIAGGLGAVALFLYMRSGGSKEQGDDGSDSSDYQLGYYLPGSSGMPSTDAGDGSDTTSNALIGIAGQAQQLQANEIYAGIWSETIGQLTKDLKATKNTGAAGKFNFGGQVFDFDFSFKSPTAPPAKISSNGATVHTTTKLFAGANDKAGASLGGVNR